MGVALNDSALAEDIAEIIKTEKGYRPYFNIECKIHTEKKDLGRNDGVIIAGLVLNRNYIEDTAEFLVCEMYIKPGSYIYDFYPYADNFEVTLNIVRQFREGSDKNTSGVTEERYKGIFRLKENAHLPTRPTSTRDNLNTQPPLKVSFQLIDKSVAAMRVKTTQGVIDNRISDNNDDMKSDSIMKSLLVSETDKVMINGKPSIEKISIEKADNESTRNTVLIPTGTPVMKVGKYFQEELGGVYNAGINSFIQRFAEDPRAKAFKTLFVYSLFDAGKYKDSKIKIIFFVPGSITHNSTDCQYKYKAGVLKIVPNPTGSPMSTKGSQIKSSGGGFRSANHEAMAGKPVSLTENGPEFSKTGLMTEVVDKEEKDGLNYAPYADPNKNNFENITEIMAKKGEMLTLPVDNLDPDFIFPGAPCKINYEHGHGVIVEVYGVIHKVKAMYLSPGSDPFMDMNSSTQHFTTKTLISIFVTDVGEERQAS